ESPKVANRRRMFREMSGGNRSVSKGLVSPRARENYAKNLSASEDKSEGRRKRRAESCSESSKKRGGKRHERKHEGKKKPSKKREKIELSATIDEFKETDTSWTGEPVVVKDYVLRVNSRPKAE